MDNQSNNFFFLFYSVEKKENQQQVCVMPWECPPHPDSLTLERDLNCVRFNDLSEGLTIPPLTKEPDEVSKGEIEPQGSNGAH